MEDFSTDHIMRTTRLGVLERDAMVKNRPMLVSLDSVMTKMKILRRTTKLRDADEKFKHIGFEHDFTPKQKEEQIAMKTKAKKMTEESGNFTFRVRGPPGQLWIRKIPKQTE